MLRRGPTSSSRSHPKSWACSRRQPALCSSKTRQPAVANQPGCYSTRGRLLRQPPSSPRTPPGSPAPQPGSPEPALCRTGPRASAGGSSLTGLMTAPYLSDDGMISCPSGQHSRTWLPRQSPDRQRRAGVEMRRRPNLFISDMGGGRKAVQFWVSSGSWIPLLSARYDALSSEVERPGIAWETRHEPGRTTMPEDAQASR